jgi:predicted nucleotidyltransferase
MGNSFREELELNKEMFMFLHDYTAEYMDSIIKVLSELDVLDIMSPKERLKKSNELCKNYGVRLSDVVLYEGGLKR